jgi:RNA recognition motif-containing protein
VSNMLYVGNLPISATEEAVVRKFGRFGTVLSVKLNTDTAKGRSQRSGFVEMKSSAEAQTAINGLNLANYDGRLISVYHAVSAAPALR